jgi:hypothetical protein
MSSEVEKGSLSQTKSKLWIDILIFVVFLVTMEPGLSRLPIHEWLSLSMIVGMLVHLLINWDWIIEISRRFLGKLGGQTRINYILNWLLFIDGTLLMISGLMISEVAMPAMGLHFQIGSGWSKLHDLSANTVLILLGLHTALHWSWIVSTVTRYIINPISRLIFSRKQTEGSV